MALHGHPWSILLLERNPRLGIKVLISGGGKCNITHTGSPDSILAEGFLERSERRFLRHALHRFSNNNILEMLTRHGVAWHARDNGRIFPDSGRAEDVLAAFEAELREVAVEVRTGFRATKIVPQGNAWQIRSEHEHLFADAVILATGGVSYRKVGTTGDGIHIADALGHTIVPLRSALAPIYLKFPPSGELVGIAVRDTRLHVVQNTRIVASAPGDVLFTHKGLSGPATLDISRAAARALEQGPITMRLNLLASEETALRETLVFLQGDRAVQQIKTWLEEVLPNRFVPFVLDAANIERDRKWSALKRDERTRLLATLLGFELGQVSEIPIDRGEVTAGGIGLGEVDSHTMMSKLQEGLFFAGEMLDIAGEIGGYNLQAAYSTGWVAGQSAVEFLQARVSQD